MKTMLSFNRSMVAKLGKSWNDEAQTKQMMSSVQSSKHCSPENNTPLSAGGFSGLNSIVLWLIYLR